MRKVLLATATAALVAGCVTEFTPTAPFDATEVAYITRSGSGVIEGQAFMRQRGGGVVTCAGSEVTLFPAGRYATEVVTALTGSPEGGRIGTFSGMPFTTDPGFRAMVRKTPCDAQGNFAFTGLAPGAYYLYAVIIWYAGSSYIPEGGAIVRRVTVAPGQRQRIIMN